MILAPIVLSWQPVSPDADEARRWAEQELVKPEYLAAQPNAFDRASLAVVKFFENLLNPDLGEGNGGIIIMTIVGLLLVAALVTAVLLWGKPRASRRISSAQMLLGEDDRLSAGELRRFSERSARAGDWGAAMTQRYRALARGLVERELLDPAPGATAQSIAGTAALTFPSQRAALLEAATLFDGVRYLGVAGDERGYLTIRSTDDSISSSEIQVLI